MSHEWEPLQHWVALKLGLRFSREELLAMSTVGDLYYAIMKRLETEPQTGCITSTFFLRLRKQLALHTGVASRHIKLDTPIDDILPRKLRKRCWNDMEFVLPEIPRLRFYLPDGVMIGMAATLGIGTWLWVLYLIHESFTMPDAKTLAAKILIGLSVVGVFAVPAMYGLFIQRALWGRLPKDCQTVRDLVLHGTNLIETRTRRGLPREDAARVWEQLQECLADVTLGVPKDFKPTTRL
jgi:hypothetical protein